MRLTPFSRNKLIHRNIEIMTLAQINKIYYQILDSFKHENWFVQCYSFSAHKFKRPPYKGRLQEMITQKMSMFSSRHKSKL